MIKRLELFTCFIQHTTTALFAYLVYSLQFVCAIIMGNNHNCIRDSFLVPRKKVSCLNRKEFCELLKQLMVYLNKVEFIKICFPVDMNVK